MALSRKVVFGAMLFLASPVGAVRSNSESADEAMETDLQDATVDPTICKVTEVSGGLLYGVAFAFKIPSGTCRRSDCKSPATFFERYLLPERKTKKNGNGLIRALPEHGKCLCKYAEGLFDDDNKSYDLTYFILRRGGTRCTPSDCWHQYGMDSIAAKVAKEDNVTSSASHYLHSGNHWDINCEEGSATKLRVDNGGDEAYIEMPGLNTAKEVRRQQEEEEERRREEERVRQEEEERRIEAERKRQEEALKRAREEEAQRERERLEAARQAALEAERAEEQRLLEEQLRVQQEKRDREEAERRRIEEERLRRQRELEELAEEEARRAADAKGVKMDNKTWKITLLWDEDNVDLDLHFYEKTWAKEIYFMRENRRNGFFELDLDDQGGNIERRGKYHVENVNFKHDGTLPNGEYFAYVNLWADKRYESRGPIPFQLNMKGLGGTNGAVACGDNGSGAQFTCFFESPTDMHGRPTKKGSSARREFLLPLRNSSMMTKLGKSVRAQFEFKVTDGHLKLNWPDNDY